MPSVDINSVMEKVDSYIKSDEGKERIDEFVKTKRKSDNGRLASGDYIITLKDMEVMAEELIATMKEEACRSVYNLPQSVIDHFESLRYTKPQMTNSFGSKQKTYSIDIYFEDDLSRMSLTITKGSRAGQRTGEGIKNIVALFDTGYQASKQVEGVWEGHEDAGDILSRTEREGKYFIELALEAFNRKFEDGSRFPCLYQYDIDARVTASPDFYSNFNY